MFVDSHIAGRIEGMIAGIHSPPAPMHQILRGASQPQALRPHRSAMNVRRRSIAIAALFASIVASVPIVAPGVVQSLQTRIDRLLQWTPPPPAPKSVDDAMVARRVSFAMAQTLVHFHIVPPAGLPRDVVSHEIFASPTAIYARVTRTWRMGPPSLTFAFRAAKGRRFQLLAGAYAPGAGLPPKYMFDADESGPDGLPRRHRHFAWRNGGQVTSATADANLSEAEIEAIRTAMHGIPLRSAATRAELNSGSIVKTYLVP